MKIKDGLPQVKQFYKKKAKKTKKLQLSTTPYYFRGFTQIFLKEIGSVWS